MSRGGLFRSILMLVLLGGLVACVSDRSVDRTDAAEATANIGAEYLRKGENDRARVAFKRALSYDDDNFTANWGMAVVSDRMDAVEAAQRYFKSTLAIRDVPAVYNSYAAFLCSHGQPDAGVENFQKALAANNSIDRADTLANAGLCLVRAGRPKPAVDYFQRALAIDPDQATALTQMAAIAYHDGNYMRARAFIERADGATLLDPHQLWLAANIEHALDDPSAAAQYVKRYNEKQPDTPRALGDLGSMSELEQSRP